MYNFFPIYKVFAKYFSIFVHKAEDRIIFVAVIL